MYLCAHKGARPAVRLPLTWAFLIALGFPGTPAWAATRHVPEQYPTIQAGINAAVSGDTVLVAPGTYGGSGNREIELRGKDIVVRSSGGRSVTIIDCGLVGRGFYIHESEPSTTRVEGFTIWNGFVGYGAPDLARGAGIFCSLTSAAIVDCRIEHCRSQLEGGGLYTLVYDGLVERCVFFDNYALSTGGGIYCEYGQEQIRDCTFMENGSLEGGGLYLTGGSQKRLVGCTVAGNYSYGGGGGGISSTTHLILERCIVWDNCSTGDGDEIWCGYADFHCSDIDRAGVESNVEVTYDPNCIDTDPMFCAGLACGALGQGDWTLQESSPCLPQFSPCGELIGSLDAGCAPGTPTGACCFVLWYTCQVTSEHACEVQHGNYLGDGVLCDPDPCGPTAVEKTSWGRIKAAYR